MRAELWDRAQEVFATAIGLDAASQATYLDAVCLNDQDLRAEVASLIQAHQVADAIVDRLATDYVDPEDLNSEVDSWVGRRIGAFELTELLGRGGMGEVYKARRNDADFHMTVAIKLVRAGYRNESVVRRFKTERQLLATLNHPHIARLLDGGATDDGIPYLVMELIKGEPIDQYCAARQLPVSARLRLFLQVCAAVSYAHRHLIVHRDLKPSNILVGADGSVKLLDFGIAKLMQPGADLDSAVTAVFALTPAFTSPEQILGLPITTAADVYSLGVVLFHMLTDASPYRTPVRTTQDAIREVCHAEPLRPSALLQAAGLASDRELDSIVLMALRKEPGQRYTSVDQFAEDIRRSLTGLPALAHGNHLSYRLRKFVRRYRFELGATVAVGALLLAGMAVSLLEARRAEQQRVRAERYFHSVRTLANSFMFQVHDAIRDLNGGTAARQLIVNTSLEYLNTLAKEAQSDQGLQLDLAAAYTKLGDIQGQVSSANMGDPLGAERSYRRAAELLTPLVAREPSNVGARIRLIRIYTDQGALLLWNGDAKAAKKISAQGVQMSDALAREFPADANVARTRHAVYVWHATNLRYAGETAEALRLLRLCIQELESLHAAHPDDRATLRDLAGTYTNAGSTRWEESVEPDALAEAVSLQRKAVEFGIAALAGKPNDVGSLRGLFAARANLANVLAEQGDVPGAVALYEDNLAIGEQMIGDSGNFTARVDTSLNRAHLGYALLRLNKLTEARSLLERSVRDFREVLERSDTVQPEFMMAYSEAGLGELHLRLAEKDTARNDKLQDLRAARDWFEDALPRMQRVQAGIVLGIADRRVGEQSREGVRRTAAAIAALEGGKPARKVSATSLE